MRLLKRRILLPQKTRNKLALQKASLLECLNPSEICEQRFNAARDRKWFKPVREALISMAGASRTCMFCDHNEPTDVEHFRPKMDYPRHTFSWGNLLWVCATCNRLKGSKFPPHNCPGAALIDPTVDNVWEYFWIDEFGNLVKRWDPNVGEHHRRAKSTCDYIHIDREEIQTRRQKRLKGLTRSVHQALEEFRNGIVNVGDLTSRTAEWLSEPFQADVADYFFRGPGRAKTPFAEFLAIGIDVSN
jgi:uncharacterized protein (TIGR02646 family)